MTYEIVFYRFRPDVPHGDAVRVVDGFDAFLRRCPGFLGRHVLYDEGHRTWIDIAEWASMADAKAAAAAFNDSADGATFMALAEHTSVQLFHASTVRRTTVAQEPAETGA